MWTIRQGGDIDYGRHGLGVAPCGRRHALESTYELWQLRGLAPVPREQLDWIGERAVESIEDLAVGFAEGQIDRGWVKTIKSSRQLCAIDVVRMTNVDRMIWSSLGTPSVLGGSVGGFGRDCALLSGIGSRGDCRRRSGFGGYETGFDFSVERVARLATRAGVCARPARGVGG
jgi:hypothetical protein